MHSHHAASKAHIAAQQPPAALACICAHDGNALQSRRGLTRGHACASQGYYQEAGRAGRDGGRAECVLLYAARDCPRILRMLRMGRGRSRAKFEKGVALLNQVPIYAKSAFLFSKDAWPGAACTPPMRGVAS